MGTAIRFAPMLLQASVVCCLQIFAVPAIANSGGTDILSAETLTATADVRLVGVDGERSWTQGGFGKTRFGGDDPARVSDFHLKPTFGDANLVWHPRFSWSLSGTVVGLAQGGPGFEVGLSEAFMSWKPLSQAAVRVSARAGLMWPPVSLEHAGPEWAVTNTITPSAINSWIGEEVKVVGGEISVSTQVGAHKLTALGGVFDGNDTAGALLAFRGWALGDRKVLIGRRQPLPPLSAFGRAIQPSFTHPVLDVDPGFFQRPGYYAKVAWDLPLPLHLEYLHYDNRGNPEAVNADQEWGWRTRFHNIGLVAEITPLWQVRAQGMTGSTLMGFPMQGRLWVDTRFRSAFALLTRQFAHGSATARIEAFGTRNRGSVVTMADDENGWAATLAAKRTLNRNFAVLLEGLHVESSRATRERADLMPEESGNQVQMSVRARW